MARTLAIAVVVLCVLLGSAGCTCLAEHGVQAHEAALSVNISDVMCEVGGACGYHYGKDDLDENWPQVNQLCRPLSQFIADDVPITKRCRRGRLARALRRQSCFSVEHNPEHDNHCLFECFAWRMYGSRPIGLDHIHALRCQAVSLWQHLADTQVMGLNCAQVARVCHTSRRSYLASLLRSRWGGFREALLLSVANQIPLRIWSQSGEILVKQQQGHGPYLDLLYSNSHYVVVSIPARVMLWDEYTTRATHLRQRMGRFSMGAGGGEGVSAMKARITQKLSKQGVQAPGQLVAAVWKRSTDGG